MPIKERARRRDEVLLVIRGAFPGADDLEWIDPDEAECAFLHLPGFFSPTLSVTSIGAFIAAFDDVIQARFAGRPVTVVGLSMGAVVAAGLRSPEVRARALVEPFFQTGSLWALQEHARNLVIESPDAEAWCWAILGVDRTRSENRDYRAALRAHVPTIAVAGSEPLWPRRPMWKLPSLTTPEDRELLERAGAHIRQAAGGHDLPIVSPEAVSIAVQDALALARRS